ncbi:MAG: MBL fold metallo-hydrolase [Candidatus Aenigmarchaeota archaeon]|nr:MBL fold metallo-hydrolase [Candidatus Aenigmarchaeota archaeon]
MRLTFLGTGGGRVVVMKQLKATGGWVLEIDNEKIHIDPGPGALVRARQYRTKIERLTAVVVSHAHPDHYTDAEMMIEVMTEGGRKRKGVLIGNEHVINGGDGYRPVVSPFHLNALEAYHVLTPNRKVRIGNIEVLATETRHTEPKGIGLVFKGSRTLGYTSDGEYFKGQEKYFQGCDYLVLNVLRPKGIKWPKHMNSEQAVKLISAVKPKIAIINHFGLLMLKAGVDKEAKWIEEQTGVKVIAAKDGMTINLENTPEGLGKWIR